MGKTGKKNEIPTTHVGLMALRERMTYTEDEIDRLAALSNPTPRQLTRLVNLRKIAEENVELLRRAVVARNRERHEKRWNGMTITQREATLQYGMGGVKYRELRERMAGCRYEELTQIQQESLPEFFRLMDGQ